MINIKNILFVEGKEINLTTREMKRKFYIFNDGRLNCHNYLNIESCYNKRKYNLRIYKTYQMESYINSLELI